MTFLPAAAIEITPLISFGLLLLLGAVGGYTAHRISWLPSITGFMAIGFVAGPSGLGVLTEQTLGHSRIFIDIALGLILYRLGLSLDLRALRRSPHVLIVSLAESTLTFLLVFQVLSLLGVDPVVTALIASIAVSSSPAVLLHVAHEVGASGPVTESAKLLVALNNLFSFLAFSAVLPLVHLSVNADWVTVVFEPLYRLLGSCLLGAAIAYVLHYISLRTHTAKQYQLALVIGAIMVTLGLALELKLSTLLAPLMAGVVIRTLEQESVISSLEFGSAFELFFIVLFVYAGANLHIAELIAYAPVIAVLVLTRSVTKWAGVALFTRLTGGSVRDGSASGLLLIPMAGMAIGLVQTAGQLFPQYASTISALVLGAVTVFEALGPPIAAFAFRSAGECAATEKPGVTPNSPGKSPVTLVHPQTAAPTPITRGMEPPT